MKPLGRVPSRFPSKTDARIVGYPNWWESAFTCGGKNYEKKLTKQVIKEELIDYDLEKNKKILKINI